MTSWAQNEIGVGYRSGSRQDFRGFTLRLETLDEFRYPQI